MHPLSLPEVFSKLFLTIILCSLIGIERELRDKDAGLRTHILVGVGSALIVLTSFHVFDIYNSQSSQVDPTRMIAAITAGIGFLCGGAIIRGGRRVWGLTTAASLWIVSCIGMAVGAGLYQTATIFTVSVFIVLTAVRYIENKVKKRL